MKKTGSTKAAQSKRPLRVKDIVPNKTQKGGGIGGPGVYRSTDGGRTWTL